MKPPVRAAWRRFNDPIEDVIPWMYQDKRGLITTGVGNLIDPVSTATPLPWMLGDRLATADEIRAEWQRVKDDKTLAQKGALAARHVTKLRLDPAGIDAIVTQRLLSNEQIVRSSHIFAGWDDFPADAQLAVLSMSWALGPSFAGHWPRFGAACHAMAFDVAGGECKIDETGNPGVEPRNDANRLCFANAAKVMARGLDRGVLHWPVSI